MSDAGRAFGSTFGGCLGAFTGLGCAAVAIVVCGLGVCVLAIGGCIYFLAHLEPAAVVIEEPVVVVGPPVVVEAPPAVEKPPDSKAVAAEKVEAPPKEPIPPAVDWLAFTVEKPERPMVREWQLVGEERKFTAEFRGYAFGVVSLLLPDGTPLKLHVLDLVPADREWIRQLGLKKGVGGDLPHPMPR